MKRFILLILLICFLVMPVSAQGVEINPPDAPDSAAEFMPAKIDDFGDSLWFVLKKALKTVAPNLASAAKVCVSLFAISAASLAYLCAYSMTASQLSITAFKKLLLWI